MAFALPAALVIIRSQSCWAECHHCPGKEEARSDPNFHCGPQAYDIHLLQASVVTSRGLENQPRSLLGVIQIGICLSVFGTDVVVSRDG